MPRVEHIIILKVAQEQPLLSDGGLLIYVIQEKANHEQFHMFGASWGGMLHA